MSFSRLTWINIAIYALASFVAGYLVYNHYVVLNGEMGFHSFCSVNTVIDCDAVNGSRYSEVLGVPMATLGLGYALFAIFLNLLLLKSAYSRREAALWLLLLSGAGVAVSLTMASITILLIKKICLFCTSLCVLNTAAFVLSVWQWKTLGLGGALKVYGDSDKKKLVTYAFLGAVLLMVTHAAASQLHKPQEFDAESFGAEYRNQPVNEVPPGPGVRLGFQGANPPVQIVEFADFQCPACGFAARQMHHLLRLYDSKVQLVFRNFPLDQSCNPYVPVKMHEFACLAAKSAVCAGKFGKFEKMFETLFENQKQISVENIHNWAKDMNLPMADFDACVHSEETSKILHDDMNLANKLGLISTPTFFVNGRKVEGAIDEPRLQVLLKELGK